MSTRLMRTLVSTIATGLIACGGSTPEPAATRATPPPASVAQATPASLPQATPAKRNACAFVDRAEIEKLAGKALNVIHDIQEENQSACEFSDPESRLTVFAVTVIWVGGKRQADVELAAVGMAAKMLQAEDADLKQLTGSESVRGLADKAFYSDLMPSWILKGDVMVKTIAPTWESARTKKAFLLTARKALSTLGS